MPKTITSCAHNGTLRFIYPQWQGGDIAHWIKEVPNAEDAARGYYLGAQLLNFLAPDNGQRTVVVPVDTSVTERRVVAGVLDRDVIIRQTQAALAILNTEKPNCIVTLGGECSVSVVPFTYLYSKYNGDVAVVWIDAHPDLTLPGDVYAGYHAMALTACMGYGEDQLMELLPARVPTNKVLLVGVRNWERNEIKDRQRQYGIKNISSDEIALNSDAVISWLNACGASKVLVHFDMDVLDPNELIVAVGTDAGGMKMQQVVRLINDIARMKELVGITVAEAMPRTAIRIKRMLEQLPLLG